MLRLTAAAVAALAITACSSTGMQEDAEVFTPQEVPTPQQPVEGMQETQQFATAEMQVVLEKLVELGAKPISTLTPQQARSQPSPADAVVAVLRDRGMSTAPEAVADTRDITVPAADGSSLPARIYMPAGLAAGERLPVIGYWHGGGWVIANIDTYDASARALANAAQAIVVSFDYRQAPEHKFPAAHEDAWSAWQWLTANAASFGGDPSRIAVAGESAGGNLAANVSIRARDEGSQMPLHQLLVYPVASDDLNSPSYMENRDAMPLSREGMQWFFDYYLPSSASMSDPRIDLIDANLADLPPTTIVTAELDPLRWEGRTLAERITNAGGAASQETYRGVTHEFFGMAAQVPQAKQAQAFAAGELKASLDR